MAFDRKDLHAAARELVRDYHVRLYMRADMVTDIIKLAEAYANERIKEEQRKGETINHVERHTIE